MDLTLEIFLVFNRMIVKFFKRDSLDKMMFAWVSCLRYNMPSISVEKAIEQFIKYFGVSDDCTATGAKRAYYRMLTEYNETIKTQNNDDSTQTSKP